MHDRNARWSVSHLHCVLSGCFSDLPDFAGSCHNGVLWQRRNTLRRPENLGNPQKKEKYERGTRSYIMSHIRGKDTSIEMMVRSFLFSKGLRFRKNDKRYPGHPDVVLPKYRTMVFINGCFWHMHENCPKATRVPKSNVEFWSAKLLRNHERDVRQHAELETMGWKVIVVWECELAKKVREERLERLYHEIVGTQPA